MNKLTKLTMSTILGLGLVIGGTALPATAKGPEDRGAPVEEEPKKVYVCKYVGTPGVDERLQTGNNPIEVSVNAIPISPVVIGSKFADGQGNSIVIAFSEGPGGGQTGEPTVADCPEPTKPVKPEPTVVVTPVESLDCVARLVTTTTTTRTTDWVYDASTGVWVAGAPVDTQTVTTRPATEQECPITPPVEEKEKEKEKPPVVTSPTITTPVTSVNPGTLAPETVVTANEPSDQTIYPDRLANTGIDPLWVTLGSLALLALGVLLFLVNRKKRV